MAKTLNLDLSPEHSKEPRVKLEHSSKRCNDDDRHHGGLHRQLFRPSADRRKGPPSLIVLDALTYAGHRENLEGLPGPGSCELVVGSITDGALVAELLGASISRTPC